MEKEIVPKAQFRFIGLNIDPPRTIKSVIKYIKSFGHAYRILKQEDPDAVVGFGNYISVPVLAMSFLLRKKIYLQEQNADLGFANRLFYRFAQFTFWPLSTPITPFLSNIKKVYCIGESSSFGNSRGEL